MNCGNQWYVEVFGECNRRVRDQPVVRVHDVGPPRLVSAAPDREAGAHHRMAHGQCPGHHVGAEVELMWVLRGGDNPDTLGDLIGRRVRAGIGATGPTAEHHDLVAGGDQRRREVVDVTTEPADHHRRVLPRHHQDFHGRRLPRDCAQRGVFLRRVAQPTRTLALIGELTVAGVFVRRARRTARRRDSSRRPVAARGPGGPTPSRRRSLGWHERAGVRDTAHSRRPSPY